MKITALGAGGWLPREQKTSTFLVEHKNKLIILDAGSGILNLEKVKTERVRFDEIHIILTHYHLDHIMGLTYLDLFVGGGQKVYIYAPGAPFYTDGPKKILDRFMSSPYTPKSISATYFKSVVVPYGKDAFKIGDAVITPKVQKHTDYSFSINIDNIFLYATDTEFNLLDEIKGSNFKIIFQECWDCEIKPTIGHTYFKQLLNAKNGIKDTKIVLVHMNPDIKPDELLKIIGELHNINGEICRDMGVYYINEE